MTSESNTMTHHHPRKSHRVYRSPSSPSEPSPYAKSSKETMMEIDAKDEEAGTILMALSQHATRIRSNSVSNDRNATIKAAAAASTSAMTARSNSMSIRNLLDNETSSSTEIPSIRPYQSISTGYKPRYETRRKGFQICLTQRSAVSTDEDMYHHRRKQRSFSRYPNNHNNNHHHSKYHPVLKIRGNTAHIHISYRIHAHQASLYETNTPKPTKTIHSSYPRTSHSAPYMDHHHGHPYSYR
ncbi:uncharacterized protein ATC70_011593 [Mucor velutinosus]|uniref:Uncharacterized protein n=1 Tax=Mucor velutinosus TaxID=708070 RepID=A0AAN7DGH2_9FUNG|nr:hypothetical protein ATC70_011593 [Mucor velutinosus]